MVIAPLSANMLAKIVNGLCGDLLSSVVRAWDTTGIVDGRGRRRIVVAPAMNTCMWRHPLTARQVRVLDEEWGGGDGWFDVLRPVEKTLACGDTGDGAMMPWEDIVKDIERRLGQMANGEKKE
jgi:phosphopantothenoylcysteine decarboxylase